MKTNFNEKAVNALKFTFKEYLDVTRDYFLSEKEELKMDGFAKFLGVDKIVSVNHCDNTVFVVFE